jgi:glutamate mutase epsilon subunit
MENTNWIENQKVNAESFGDIKDALRKTLHVMIDLDFDDGKLDETIRNFINAKKFQIRLTLNLNPNDVILIRNLTKSEITEEVLENIRRLRNSIN